MTNVLTDLSDALAQVVKAAGPAVVRVEGRRRLAASGIIWSAEGFIVTANHVVRRDEVKVGLAEGQSVTAKVIGRDPSTDLAVLQVEAGDLAPAERADDAQVGQLVLALGRPGKSVQATLGIVSAVGHDGWRTAMGGQIDRYLQTDVVMYPGFSGGPLVNAAGQVLALNSSALLRGVSVSVPVTTIDKVVTALQTHGHMRRGYLGVSTQLVRLPDNMQETAGQSAGLLIVSVESGSPAEKGGLVLGDTLIALDGHPVRSHDDLLALLSGDRVDSKVPVDFIRGGEKQSLNVRIDEKK